WYETTFNTSPSTEMPSPTTSTSPGNLPATESYFSRCAIVSSDPRSLTATKSMSAPCSLAARKKFRPMRPNPLIPTRIAMSHLWVGCSPQPLTAGTGDDTSRSAPQAPTRSVVQQPLEGATQPLRVVRATVRAGDPGGHRVLDAVGATDRVRVVEHDVGVDPVAQEHGDVVRHLEPLGLGHLRLQVAHVHQLTPCGAHRVADAVDLGRGEHAGEQRAGPEHQLVRAADRLDRIGARLDSGRLHLDGEHVPVRRDRHLALHGPPGAHR